MNSRTPLECRACRHPISPHTSRQPGTRRSAGRGICCNCYDKLRRDDCLDFFPPLGVEPPRRGRRPEHVLEELEFLAGQFGGVRESTKVGWSRPTRERVAERLGMRLGSLDRAVWRAAARRDRDGVAA